MMSLRGKTIQTQSASPSIQMKDQEGGERIPTFEMVAYTGDQIRQGFYPNPMVVNLAGMDIPSRSIPIRMGHDSREGVGHADDVKLAGEGGLVHLVATGVISRDTEAAREVVASAGKSFPWQASIGAEILAYEEIKAGKTTTVNGREFAGPILVVTKSKLSEISFVDLGADSNTTASIAAAHETTLENGGHQMTQEENAGAGSADQVQAQSTPAGENNIAAGAVADLEDLRTKANIDAARQSKIHATAKRTVEARPELADTIIDHSIAAIESGVSASDFELEMIRFSRDIKGVGAKRRDRSISGEVVEAALCIAGGLEDDKLQASFSEDVLNKSDMQFSNGLGLADAIMVAAKEKGFSGISLKNDLETALRCAFDANTHSIQAGASSISLPNVFSNVANKFLKAGFDAVDNSASQIAEVVSARDFKQMTSLAFGGDYIMKKLAPSGEIEHAEPGETTYSNQADTYARMLVVNRQQIFNDDLGALTAAPRKHGRGGAMAFNQDFWTKFEDNSSFFTTSNGSKLSAGAGTALSIDSLTDAMTAFMDQTDPDGHPLGIRPSILLVPNALAATAMQLMNSTEVRGQSGAFGTANPHAGALKVVVSPYLTSATAWYLLAAPGDLPVIQSAFLNGRRRPTVETAQADFNVLAVQMRGYFDFGNALQEFRAGVMSPGA